jgi:hypothetical protein
MIDRNNSTRNIPRCAKQHGAALVVGLVLMLVLTVLGISGMNTATLELVMASNNQSQQLAFQAAETGIDLAVGSNVHPPTGITPFASGPARSQMRCVEITDVPGRAFSRGVAGGSVIAYHFDVVAVGTGPRNAVATHTQGFYVPGRGTVPGVGC